MNRSTSLLDLMELWEIFNDQSSVYFLRGILTDAEIDERIDKAVLSDMIVAECGGMVTRYNESATFYRMAVSWFKSRKEQITHLLDALWSEYKPLEEFRYTEKEVLDGRKKTDNDTTQKINETVTNNGGATDKLTGLDIETHSVSAENESTFQPREQTQTSRTNDTSNTHNDTTGTTANNTTDFNGLEKRDDTITRDHYGHKSPSQVLAMQEYEVAQENVYDIITNWFADALMLPLYM